MKHALWAAFCLSLMAGPAAAGDTDPATVASVRAFVMAALPGQCDEDMDGDASYPDAAISVAWKPGWGDGSEPEEQATLYRIFCFAGAYSTIHAYAIKPAAGNLALVTFAQPTFTIDRVEDDDTFTKLKGPPRATGFVTVPTLIDSEFDSASNTLTSKGKWRGMGDAWSRGTWQLRDGQFVLTEYEIDPIYEFNLDNPGEELIDTYFEIYP